MGPTSILFNHLRWQLCPCNGYISSDGCVASGSLHVFNQRDRGGGVRLTELTSKTTEGESSWMSGDVSLIFLFFVATLRDRFFLSWSKAMGVCSLSPSGPQASVPLRPILFDMLATRFGTDLACFVLEILHRGFFLRKGRHMSQDYPRRMQAFLENQTGQQNT